MTQASHLPEPFIETISGFVAGIATTFVVHPLDLIKTRLQVGRTSNAQSGSSVRLIYTVVRQEGGLRALYRGLVPNLVGNSVSWAVYFGLYEELKAGALSLHGGTSSLSYWDYFFTSGVAGILTTVCTNPIWVIKTRMLSTAAHQSGAYRSVSEGIRQILHHDGVRGFYRGILPSLLGVSHGAVQFMAYEQMKNYQRSSLGEGKSLQNRDYILCSGISKAIAGTLTYPYQVVRSRLQSHNAEKEYRGIRDVVGQILRHEGAHGLYKGLAANLARVVPSSCVTLLVYENTKARLSRIGANRIL